MVRDGDGWRRSSKCDNSGPNCVEVLKVIDCVYVRDSKDPGMVLTFTEPEWKAFIEGAKDDEFDLPDDDDDEVDSEDEEDDKRELDAAVR